MKLQFGPLLIVVILATLFIGLIVGGFLGSRDGAEIKKLENLT